MLEDFCVLPQRGLQFWGAACLLLPNTCESGLDLGFLWVRQWRLWGEGCSSATQFSYVQGSKLNTRVLCSTWKLHDNQTWSLPSRVLTQNFMATSCTSLFLEGRQVQPPATPPPRVAVNLVWETGKPIKRFLRLNTSSLSQTSTRHQNWK